MPLNSRQSNVYRNWFRPRSMSSPNTRCWKSRRDRSLGGLAGSSDSSDPEHPVAADQRYSARAMQRIEISGNYDRGWQTHLQTGVLSARSFRTFMKNHQFAPVRHGAWEVWKYISGKIISVPVRREFDIATSNNFIDQTSEIIEKLYRLVSGTVFQVVR